MQCSCLEQGLGLRSIRVQTRRPSRPYIRPRAREYGHQSVMGLGVDGGGDVEVRVKTGLFEKTGREGGRRNAMGLRVGAR